MNRNNTGQRVYDAVVDLTSTGRRAHRTTLSEHLGMALVTVDDNLKRLKNDGRLKLIERGVYMPIPPAREDRAVSNTMLPDGTCKLEVGDEVLHLTMREARMVSAVVGGIGLHFGALPA